MLGYRQDGQVSLTRSVIDTEDFKHMKYFIPLPTTAEELKKAYRKLSMQYHPDRGGNVEDMQKVNDEYSTLFEKLKNIHTNAKGEKYESKKETSETPEHFIKIIDELIRFEGVKIEIIGTFIWCSGNTKPYKEEFKRLNFKWSSNKLSWYLSPPDYNKNNNLQYSMDELRDMFGSEEVVNKPLQKLTTT